MKEGKLYTIKYTDHNDKKVTFYDVAFVGGSTFKNNRTNELIVMVSDYKVFTSSYSEGSKRTITQIK
jgi:hypothetical protein